jgi:hypothetical protein
MHLRGAGCAKCAQMKISGHLNNMTLNGQASKFVSIDDFISRARAIHGNRYNYSKTVYRKSTVKVEIICPKHGSFWKEPNGHIHHKQGCPKCQLSKGELAIAVYFEKSAISYEMQKTFVGLVGKNGGSLKFDFYIPSRNMLIEYDGEHHFGCKTYKDRRFSQEQIDNLQRNDRAKDAYAGKNGIGLLRIPFTEKDNITEILREKVVEAPIVRGSGSTLMGLIGIQDGETF